MRKIRSSLLLITMFVMGTGGHSAPLPQNPLPAPAPTSGVRTNSKGEIIVPMVFPVLQGSKWTDTHGALRAGDARKHQGQDLPAPKMRPLVACFDGVWFGSGIEGDNGCIATYLYINDDRPGTNDGQGGEEFAYAPGIQPGTRVRAGQHVAYCGDSGSAEKGGPHLHFELAVPGKGTINAAPSLRAATVLKEARYPIARPEIRPGIGHLRLDGQVIAVNPDRGVVGIRVAAWGNPNGKVTPQVSPSRRWAQLTDEADASAREVLNQIAPGDFIAVLGRDLGDGKAIPSTAIVLLRQTEKNKARRTAATRPTNGPSDEDTMPDLPPVPRMIIADFEKNRFPDWEFSGNCWGTRPEGRSFAGNTISGWAGNAFLTSSHPNALNRGPESGTGRALSPAIQLPRDATAIEFLIAGGRYPDRCCVNLLLDDKVVRSASAENQYQMKPVSWDVKELRGKKVRIEVRDDVSVGTAAFVHVDDFALLRDIQESPF